ncbi:hypothetical protein HWV62_9773 [Athelia sp. TMB]|nr:hypothetical protein HWV62_29763 [Athelia sp. TMB]KAF7975334.1 hypothetical protein HWV62_9773 [Athelia sp. TMB]
MGRGAAIGDAVAEAEPTLNVVVAWSGLVKVLDVVVGMLATIRLLWVKNENCELMDCVLLDDSVDDEDPLVAVGVEELLLPVGNEMTEAVVDAVLLLLGADVMPELQYNMNLWLKICSAATYWGALEVPLAEIVPLEVPLAETVPLVGPDGDALPEDVLDADCETSRDVVAEDDALLLVPVAEALPDADPVLLGQPRRFPSKPHPAALEDELGDADPEELGPAVDEGLLDVLLLGHANKPNRPQPPPFEELGAALLDADALPEGAGVLDDAGALLDGHPKRPPNSPQPAVDAGADAEELESDALDAGGPVGAGVELLSEAVGLVDAEELLEGHPKTRPSNPHPGSEEEVVAAEVEDVLLSEVLVDDCVDELLSLVLVVDAELDGQPRRTSPNSPQPPPPEELDELVVVDEDDEVVGDVLLVVSVVVLVVLVVLVVVVCVCVLW